MHQPLHAPGHETVVDEDVFLDVERLVAPFEVAGAVPGDAVAEDEILRARRRPDGIRLDEPHAVERAFEGRGGEERARCREAAEIVEGHDSS